MGEYDTVNLNPCGWVLLGDRMRKTYPVFADDSVTLPLYLREGWRYGVAQGQEFAPGVLSRKESDAVDEVRRYMAVLRQNLGPLRYQEQVETWRGGGVWVIGVDGVTLDAASPGPHVVLGSGDLHLDCLGYRDNSGSPVAPTVAQYECPKRSELVSSVPRILEQVVLPVAKDDPAWLRQWPTAVSVGGGAFTITLPAGAVPPRALGWLITDPELWSSGKVPDPANVGSGGPARMGRAFAARWWE